MRWIAVRNGAAAASAVALSGCAGWQSALDRQGVQALQVGRLIDIIVFVCTIIWILVVVVLLLALRRRNSADQPLGTIDVRQERRMAFTVGAAVAATVVIISIFTLMSFLTTRAGTLAAEDLVIKVRAQQWWWEITYIGRESSPSFMTANELHIPIGRNVRLQLESADVIHSFWVPNLAGKQDLIPGRINDLTIRAERAGVYRGQCAEFCGLQHAHMAFFVVAEEQSAYEAWATSQARPADGPTDPEASRGQQLFNAKPCAACHTIRGTQAAGTTSPDLTHVASRRTIAAGLLETTRGSLAAWIADPQTLKPGNNMPMVPLSPDELKAITAYMASLK